MIINDVDLTKKLEVVFPNNKRYNGYILSNLVKSPYNNKQYFAVLFMEIDGKENILLFNTETLVCVGNEFVHLENYYVYSKKYIICEDGINRINSHHSFCYNELENAKFDLDSLNKLFNNRRFYINTITFKNTIKAENEQELLDLFKEVI